MHFYRPLAPIAAMTFDLDDTLYDNAEVIQRTEAESVRFLQAFHPGLRSLDAGDFQRLRAQLRQEEPDIYHDVTEWRRRAVEKAMLAVGMSARDANEGALQAMAHFAHWRSQIVPTDETHATLQALSERLPLVAITNGNAEPHRFGLHRYFRFILRAGPDGRAKPFSDMYQLAAQRLSLPPEQILHVGDDLITDVAGAVRGGLQACWINLCEVNLMQNKNARLLPHMEISRLASLITLL